MNPSDTIVAISSAVQGAPRGIVRLSGQAAFAAASRVVAAPEVWRPVAGPLFDLRLRVADWPLVEAFALRFVAPRSVTGEDVVELHVPGCVPLLEALTADLLAPLPPELGMIRLAERGEFSLRAFLNGRLDLSQAEAVGALIGAYDPTQAAQKVAGLLARSDPTALRPTVAARVAAWRQALIGLLARLEVALDFADDEDLVTAAKVPQVVEELSDLAAAIAAVVATQPERRADHGERPNVVLGGPPNAGKSSLFNALVGRRSAIVSKWPGTTRDAVMAELTEPPLNIWDTAGIDDSPGLTALDRVAWDRSREMFQRAHLVLWCWPADVTPQEPRELQASACKVAWWLIQTKCDREATWTAQTMARAWNVPWICTSAVRPDGVEMLRRDLSRWWLERSGTELGSVAVNARQVSHLDRALTALRRGIELARDFSRLELAALELGEADHELAAILGVDPATGACAEDVIQRIFQEFCVGK